MSYKIFLIKNGQSIEMTSFNINDYDKAIIDTYYALKNQPVPAGSKIEAYVPGGHVMEKRVAY